MSSSPSCFRRGPGGGKAANRRSPLGLSACKLTPRLYDRAVEALRIRHWRLLVAQTGEGSTWVGLNKS
jgi:hypothetical protein